MARRLAYFGPPGTFTEQAALRHDPGAKLLPFLSISAVATAVSSGMADEGVVPIENSLEGSVNETLDILIHESTLSIRGELVLPIEHCLLVAPGMSAEEIRVIYSHPQALGQCRRFIERCFPRAQAEAALSTSAAVEQAMASPGAAALGTRRAAEIYGAEILAAGVQDQETNVTRFVVLGHDDAAPTGADRTSIAFTVPRDVPGVLVACLLEFAERKINLSKIESRPSRESLGKYIFLVDLEGHRNDPEVKEALAAVQAKASFFKIFGSYPRAGGSA